MQPSEERQPLPTRMAPPSDTEAPYLAPQQSSWPKTIGIIAIIFGALAALGGALGVITSVFAERLAGIMPADQRDAMRVAQEMGIWGILDQAARCALGILLIVAGARLTNRNASGVRLCRLWATLKILVAIGAGVLTVLTFDRQLALMMQSPAVVQANISPALLRVMMLFGIGLGLLWGAALPVFILVWMARGSIKAEVRSWQHVDTIS